MAATTFRRGAEAAAFVAVWMTLGFALRLDPNVYLVIGVPLTIAFQVLVARRPLLAAWVREAPPPRLGLLFAGLAVLLGAFPAHELWVAARARELIRVAWLTCAMAGSFGAAYAVTQATRRTLRELLLCAGVAGGLGVVQTSLAAVAVHYFVQHGSLAPPHVMLRVFASSFARYLPVVFVLEEVSFRAVLDSHVSPSHDWRRFGSAAFVSALWGAWHLPIVVQGPDATVAKTAAVGVVLIVVHVVIGVPLTIFWRRSGNLLVPGFTHALLDAIRNALLAPG